MLEHSKFEQITTFIFDVDGVFTNSEVLIMENGDLLRTMNTRDGQSIRYALDAGFKVAIITKGASEGVKRRFENLGITDLYDKLSSKEGAFLDLVNKYRLEKWEMIYMGDDIPDLVMLDKVNIFSCPADAVDDVIKRADYISSKAGGYGCVREIVEKTMRIQGKWPVDN